MSKHRAAPRRHLWEVPSAVSASAEPRYDLPESIGGTVLGYFFFQQGAGQRLPSPDSPEDVDDVIEMIDRHTVTGGPWTRERLETLRPAIVALMREITPDFEDE